MKKFLFLVFAIFGFISFSMIDNSNHISFEDCDDTSGNYPILETYSELVAHMDEAYGYLDNYYLTCDSTYAMLSVKNFSQTELKNSYNQLGNLRFDLNGDGVINDNDNLGQSDGICQPVACSMAIKYMVERNNISYTPRLSNDSSNIYDVFYEIVDAYISNNWGGNSALTYMAADSLNTFFTSINSSYQATKITSNYLSTIRNSYSNGLPCIGHITLGERSHAVSICGYYTMTVHYTYNLHEFANDYYYLILNDGWSTSGYVDGPNSQAVFDANFSYISTLYLYALTYIA